MQIANPIYDSVFKYLLDDNRVAKAFLSAIIEEDIIELSLTPTEIKKKVKRVDDRDDVLFTIFRIDFAAKIKTNDGGNKLVLVEIQKIKFPTDIIRFRRYLGDNYSNDNNFYHEKNQKIAYPIICIYFLGYNLDFTHVPVIKVDRNYIDNTTKEIIKTQERFIESLSHDLYVVQIPQVKHFRRNDLEKLLSVFSQDNITNTKHILNVKENDVPEKYRFILRRLIEAASSQKVLKAMKVEDEYFEDIKLKDQLIFNLEQEKAKAEQEKVKAEQEKVKAEQSLLNSAKLMKQAGINIQQIANTTGLSVEDIETLAI